MTRGQKVRQDGGESKKGGREKKRTNKESKIGRSKQSAFLPELMFFQP
jgi:hypothetical protein